MIDTHHDLLGKTTVGSAVKIELCGTITWQGTHGAPCPQVKRGVAPLNIGALNLLSTGRSISSRRGGESPLERGVSSTLI